MKLFQRLKNIDTSTTVFKSTVIVIVCNIIAKLIGFVRIKVFTHKFGASLMLDSYNAAFSIFDVLYMLTLIGVIFIPFFIDLREKNKKKVWEFTSSIINFIFLVYTCFALLFIFFTPNIVKFLFSGNAHDTEFVQLTVLFIRIMLIQPLIFTLSGITGGILHSYRKFLAFAVAPIFYNLGIVLGAVLLYNHLGPAGLAWGVVIGAVIYFIIQIPSLVSVKFKYQLVTNWKSREFKKVLKVAFPRILTLLVTQFNVVVISRFASYISEGSITIFNTANSFQLLFVGALGLSLATTFFPVFSQNVANRKIKLLERNVAKALGQALFWSIPVTVFLPIFSYSIIDVLLGGGAFTPQNVSDTANALAWLSLGIASYIMLPTVIRIFYALKETRIPFISSLLAFALNFFLGLALVRILTFGVVGLAIAYSCAGLSELILLAIILRNKYKVLSLGKLVRLAYKPFFAAISGGFLVLLLYFIFDDMGEFLKLLIGGVVGIGVFIFLSYKLKIKEFQVVSERIMRSFQRKRFKRIVRKI